MNELNLQNPLFVNYQRELYRHIGDNLLWASLVIPVNGHNHPVRIFTYCDMLAENQIWDLVCPRDLHLSLISFECLERCYQDYYQKSFSIDWQRLYGYK